MNGTNLSAPVLGDHNSREGLNGKILSIVSRHVNEVLGGAI